MSSTNTNSAAHWCKAVIEEVVPKTTQSLVYPPPPKPPSTTPTNASATNPTLASSSTTTSTNAYASWTNAVNGNTPTTASSTPAVSNPYAAYMNISPAYLQYYQQFYLGANVGSGNTAATTTSVAAATASATTAAAATAPSAIPAPPVPPARAAPPAPPVPPNFNYAAATTSTTPTATANLNYKAAVTGASAYPMMQSANPMAGQWNNGYYMPMTGATQYQYSGINIAQAIPAATGANIAATLGYPTMPKKPNPSRFTNGPTEDTSAAATAAPNSRPQPAALKSYINRCLSMCKTDADRAFIGDALAKLVDKVSKEGRLYIHKWDLEPIPSLPSDAHNLTIQTNINNSDVNLAALDSTGSENKKRKSRWTDGPIEPQQQVTFTQPPSSKKQKVLSGTDEIVTLEELKLRQQRASRFQAASTDDFIALESTSIISAKNLVQNGKKGKKANKIINVQSQPQSTSVGATLSEAEIASLKIVGTCTKLEKEYLRLTSPPVPEAVRPEHILKKALAHFFKKWESDDIDYINMCSQMKSIRQDLTVQHIQNGELYYTLQYAFFAKYLRW